MSHILIIGGSDAGISAALRIKELDRQSDVTLVVADSYPGYSICGLPFFLSGEVSDWKTLAHYKTQEFEDLGIHLLLNQRAGNILTCDKTVDIVSAEGKQNQLHYNKLLIATGAEPARPTIIGLEQAGVFFLRCMEDGFVMQRYLDEERPKRVIIIGGGYIGLEMADAMTLRGLKVVVLEYLPEILASLDPEMGRLIRTELELKGVKVIVGKAVESIIRQNGCLQVRTTSAETETADMVLVATGVKASNKLAKTAAITLGASGAIRVDRTMCTNVPDVLAAGDCAETWHRIIRNYVYLPLGTTSHKQGRIAGENILGGQREFQGILGTQTVKVFDRVAAGTGLNSFQAAKAGFDALKVTITTLDHNPYYANAHELNIAIIGDHKTGQLLGAQAVGHFHSEISKRIDVVAGAIFNNLSVDDLSDLDLSYSPPLSSPWDPVQKASMQWCRVRKLN